MSYNEDPDLYGPDEWHCTVELNIYQIRALYDHVCYSIKMWPGAPARPPEEQEMLQNMKERLFAMLMEYNFEYKDADK